MNETEARNLAYQYLNERFPGSLMHPGGLRKRPSPRSTIARQEESFADFVLWLSRRVTISSDAPPPTHIVREELLCQNPDHSNGSPPKT